MSTGDAADATAGVWWPPGYVLGQQACAPRLCRLGHCSPAPACGARRARPRARCGPPGWPAAGCPSPGAHRGRAALAGARACSATALRQRGAGACLQARASGVRERLNAGARLLLPKLAGVAPFQLHRCCRKPHVQLREVRGDRDAPGLFQAHNRVLQLIDCGVIFGKLRLPLLWRPAYAVNRWPCSPLATPAARRDPALGARAARGRRRPRARPARHTPGARPLSAARAKPRRGVARRRGSMITLRCARGLDLRPPQPAELRAATCASTSLSSELQERGAQS